MNIKVNGSTMQIAEAATVAELLSELGYRDHFVAIAVNADCIPRRTYAEHHLSESDSIEILAPMAGG